MNVQRFRKKPVTVEAMHWDGTPEGATPIIDWVLQNGEQVARYHDDPPRVHSEACRCDGRYIVPGPERPVPCPETEPTGGSPAVLEVGTLEGDMIATAGDWIIRGVQGEFYPVKATIFEQTYERVEGIE